jgi:hypothetical protein
MKSIHISIILILGFASCCVYEIRVRDFRLRNLFSYSLLLFFICYMFRSYDHLQVDIYTLQINSTDNGSVVFRILANLVNNGDRSLVTVDVVAFAELTIGRCRYDRSGFSFGAVHVFGLSCIVEFCVNGIIILWL